MSSLDNAIASIKTRRFPYWKMYKGKVKVSQCDADENPDKLPEIALQHFEEDIKMRTPGVYHVVAYKNLKGESGGFQYDFSITETYQSTALNSQNKMDFQTVYQQAERDIKILNGIERLEKKMDAIGEFIIAQSDDDKDNDGASLKMLTSVFGLLTKAKTAAPAAVATTAASRGAVNGFM